jgi:ribosomal protein L32
MRHTSSHTKNRRSHHALKATNLVKDKESEALRLPHRLDESTGMYRGKQIVPTDELKRREERMKKRRSAKENPLTEGVREPVHATEDPIAAPKAPSKEGLLGRFTKGRAKARSGFGGNAG